MELLGSGWSSADRRHALAAAAKTAEEAGFAEFSVMDHYFQIEQRAEAEEPMLGAYTTLAYVAALTKRRRLAALQSPAYNR